MQQWLKLCDTTDVADGTGQVFEAAGRQLAVFQISGTWYAIDNDCPHKGAALVGGEISGTTVACPLHGWPFDLTTGVATTRPGVQVATYPVSLRGAEVHVEVPAEVTTAPAAIPTDRVLVRYGGTGMVEWCAIGSAESVTRGSRLVLTTSRGLEIGEVLLWEAAATNASRPVATRMKVLRVMTEADEQLAEAARQKQQQVFEQSRALLGNRQVAWEVVDVEVLLDGASVLVHVLGEPVDEVAEIETELSASCGGKVQFLEFGSEGKPLVPVKAGGGCSGCSCGK